MVILLLVSCQKDEIHQKALNYETNVRSTDCSVMIDALNCQACVTCPTSNQRITFYDIANPLDPSSRIVVVPTANIPYCFPFSGHNIGIDEDDYNFPGDLGEYFSSSECN